MKKAYNAIEAAEFLGRTTGSLSNLRSQGKGPPFEYEKLKVVYPYKELKAWKEKNPRTPK